MNSNVNREYLHSIIPDSLPDGRVLLEEGRKLGKTINAGRSKFIRDSEYNNYVEYLIDKKNTDNVEITTNIGLATVEEQLDGIADLYSWSKENNVYFHSPLVIPSINQGIPPAKRADAVDATSYIMETFDDFKAFGELEGVECIQANQITFVPNAMENTVNCLKTGTAVFGSFDQIMWNLEGCDNHEEYVADIVKCLGILSSKYDEGVAVNGYLDDGFSGYCGDCISYVAHALLEKYIVTDLCGARYMVGFGNLVTDGRYKAALLKALDDVLSSDEQPGIILYHAATVSQWDHDIHSNYGTSLEELLFMLLAERRYKTAANVVTVPITEKVCVPTLESIKNIMGATSRMLEKISSFESVIDFSEIDKMAEVMKCKGIEMFHNILDTLAEGGIDIEDPMKMLMFFKNFNGGFFEEAFHPSTKDSDKLKMYYPTELGLLTNKMIDEEMLSLKKLYTQKILDGKKIVVGSADCHAYGVRYVKSLLQEMGATIVDIGVDCSVMDFIDTAKEEGTKFIGISTHNGQALGLAEKLSKSINVNDYTIFMGGTLNTILPSQSEPVDVSDMIKEMGILATNDIEVSIKLLSEK